VRREARQAGTACLVAKEDAGTPMLLFGESVPTYAFPESAARVLGKVAAYAVWRAGRHGIIPDFDDIARPSPAKPVDVPARSTEQAGCRRRMSEPSSGHAPSRCAGRVAPGAGPAPEDSLLEGNAEGRSRSG